MQSNPLVSVIIPCYNHAQYIENTLDSILIDTYKNKEIIIIDDGSTDVSKTVIQSWIDRNANNITVNFYSRSNLGLCATLNELVGKANGKYLVLLASDDILCNNTIENRVRILDSNPSKMVLICDAEGINAEGDVIYSSLMSDFHKADKTRYSDESILDEIIFKFSISGPVLMVNKKIYELIGPYPEHLKAEDLFFYIKAASLGKIMFSDQIVSQYRIHEGNTSGYNPELTKTVIRTYLKALGTIPGLRRKLRILKRIIGLLVIG